jgi:hypothetical protein
MGINVSTSLATLLLATSAAPRPESPLPLDSPNEGADRIEQDWLAEPRLPAYFRSSTNLQARSGRQETASDPILPASVSQPETFTVEPSLPKGITALDIQAWREEDERRRDREWVGNTALGPPLLLPQLILEALLPRGLAVGPTTFFYRTSPGSSSLAFVVLDQILFHEAEFVSRAQLQAGDRPSYTDDLLRGQRRVLRQSLMTGFRAAYAIPQVTMESVLETAADQGLAGYLLAPSVGGALLYLKGIDQRIHIDDQFNVRFKIASGRQWIRGAHSADGLPAFSFELRLCDLPVGIVASFDLSRHGMSPAFIGVGTSLDLIEDLLGSEAAQPRNSR